MFLKLSNKCSKSTSIAQLNRESQGGVTNFEFFKKICSKLSVFVETGQNFLYNRDKNEKKRDDFKCVMQK